MQRDLRHEMPLLGLAERELGIDQVAVPATRFLALPRNWRRACGRDFDASVSLPASMRVRWLALLVLVASGCDRSSEPRKGLYCARLVAAPGEALNPLVDGHYACFETLAACSKTNSACAPSGPPRWSCTSITTKAVGDPLNGDASCHPTEAMCRASRMRPTDERVVISDCAPAASVYCSTSSDGRLQCTSDQAACERVRDLGASVVSVKSTPCMLR